MRPTSLLVVLIFTSAATSPLEAAQSRGENVKRCLAGSQENADIWIAACTGLIESGREIPENLAVFFVNRAAAFAAKDNYDRAIEDLDHALRLNPKNVETSL